ncbi:MAG: GFA family protein [Pseudomonadaceae bacterium]|nr:GFA family protein [Pseudomonadaceae bacterium]
MHTDDAMLTGRCGCHTVTFCSTKAAIVLSHCHCSECRRVYGTAFGSIVVVPRSGFRYLSGELEIACFAASPRVNRYFCRVCGSSLPLVEEWDPLVGIPLGLVNDADRALEGIKSQHIFAADALDCVVQDAPRFAAWPPGQDGNNRAQHLRD